MAQRFYKIEDELAEVGRWYLRGPRDAAGREVDPRTFTTGKPVADPGPLTIPLRHPGRRLDFTLADFDMPVVIPRLGMHLEWLAPGAVQRFRVAVEDEPLPYEILNVTREIYCLDEAASSVRYWTEEDGRPEKVGQYRMILAPVIDAARVAAAVIFRLGGWRTTIVCTAEVRDALVRRRYSGLRFEPLASTVRTPPI